MLNAKNILEKIEDVTKSDQSTKRSSRFVSPSSLGKPCLRRAFMEFRFFSEGYEGEPLSGKLMRLFARGHREEPVFINLLKKSGFNIVDEDPNRQDESIKQYMVKFAYGHGTGFIDGFIKDVSSWQPCEFKTYNDKRFKQLVKKGVKENDITYYAQCQLYTYLTESSFSVFFAVNKNDDDIYCEIIPLDETYAKSLIQKAMSLVDNNILPPRISNEPASFDCRFCDHVGVCFGSKPISKNCRTCSHGAFGDQGLFYCTIDSKNNLDGVLIEPDNQRIGCSRQEVGFSI